MSALAWIAYGVVVGLLVAALAGVGGVQGGPFLGDHIAAGGVAEVVALLGGESSVLEAVVGRRG